jgi:hypothetical protein
MWVAHEHSDPAEKLNEEGDCHQRGWDVQGVKKKLYSARQESN